MKLDDKLVEVIDVIEENILLIIKCMECHCFGILRCKKGKAILVPQFSKAAKLNDKVGYFGLKPQ